MFIILHLRRLSEAQSKPNELRHNLLISVQGIWNTRHTTHTGGTQHTGNISPHSGTTRSYSARSHPIIEWSQRKLASQTHLGNRQQQQQQHVTTKSTRRRADHTSQLNMEIWNEAHHSSVPQASLQRNANDLVQGTRNGTHTHLCIQSEFPQGLESGDTKSMAYPGCKHQA